MGQASILTITSYANRTSPVLRGKWVLENLLGQHIPPPPPNVPALIEPEQTATLTTLRQTLEAHRANPVCASCHKLMDPIGFSLENFDAVGIWRTSDHGAPINASSDLFGEKLNGVAGLRAYLTGKRQDAFVQNLATKLLTYADGRELKAADRAEVAKILAAAQGQGYRWSDIILGIAKSDSFQGVTVGRNAPQMASNSNPQSATGKP